MPPKRKGRGKSTSAPKVAASPKAAAAAAVAAEEPESQPPVEPASSAAEPVAAEPAAAPAVASAPAPEAAPVTELAPAAATEPAVATHESKAAESGSVSASASLVASAESIVRAEWERTIERTLMEYITIPNQSPAFDAEYATNGLNEKAMGLLESWVDEQKIAGLKWRRLAPAGRTPLLFITVDATSDSKDTVLMYGHMDKQPPCTGWDTEKGYGPYTPAFGGDNKELLYGRGGADDGYAVFAALTSLRILKAQGRPHARIVLLIESCEESGSVDLMHYVELLSDEIGTPSLVVCLDSSAGDYERMWLTTSLRGMLIADLHVGVLTEAVHSGAASGVVPDSFRVIRGLLDRIEDSATGEFLLPEAKTVIPDVYRRYAADTAATMGRTVVTDLPLVAGVQANGDDMTELLLASTWKTTLCITGAGGIPEPASAGNTLRKDTALKLSIRLPPNANPDLVSAALKARLEADPPYNARVELKGGKGASGWFAPTLPTWLENAVSEASRLYYRGNGYRTIGEGGSIPFMAMLGRRFPSTVFVVTGVLGPRSNAHGPNEFLHVPYTQQLICCVAHILAAHAARPIDTATPAPAVAPAPAPASA